MFFDDRLATVLRQRVSGEAGLRTQYRQLLDLLGKSRIHHTGREHQSLIAAAWLRMEALADAIPEAERARMIREPGWRFRNADLAAHLTDQEPAVASAALMRADLSDEDWTALIPRLPLPARGFLRLRRDLPLDVEILLERLGIHDRGLPPPQTAIPAPQPAARVAPEAEPAPEEVAAPRTSAPRQGEPPRDREETGRSEISALVERIAQFRRERSDVAADAEIAPRLPLGEAPERTERPIATFGFATDPGGRIAWASGEVAPMVIGTRLTAAGARDDDSAPSAAILRALARRQPITAAPFTLGGAAAIAGDWMLDAQPSFSMEGHFTGHVGQFRRVPGDPSQRARPERHEADRIRQLLHELRTPVTAVQGYAEVIQQQLFGPAPNEYRALAAAIAADAARILAGFDELDRLARLETGAMAIAPGEADLALLARRIIDQVAPVLESRAAGIDLAPVHDAKLVVPREAEEIEALLWRLLASLGAASENGERLQAQIAPMIGNGTAIVRLSCTLPAALAREENLFATTARPAGTGTSINPGLFGVGFALRLARAEACAAGGSLVREAGSMVLDLPLLTGAEQHPSPQSRSAADAAG